MKNSIPTASTLPIDTVIFDCDSTVTTIEGIDELAERKGKKDAISALTHKAMQGELPLEGVFFERIDLIRPSMDDMIAVGKQYCRSLSKNIRIVFEIFHYLAKDVYIFSAGYLPSLLVLGEYLNIPADHIFAVDVLFDREGEYLYCPRDQLLTLTDGKLRLTRSLGFSGERLAMIGDGANDLSVSEIAKIFVGYQGEKANPFMEKHAPVYLQGDDLLPFLALILTAEEKSQLAKTHYASTIAHSEQLRAERVQIRPKSA